MAVSRPRRGADPGTRPGTPRRAARLTEDLDLDAPQRHAVEPDPASVITPMSSASPPSPESAGATPTISSPTLNAITPATVDEGMPTPSLAPRPNGSNGSYNTGTLYTEGFSTGIFDAVDAEKTGTWWSSSSASERHWRSAVSADSATEPSASSAPSALEVPDEEEAEDLVPIRGRGRTPARASDQQRGPRRSTVIAVIATVVVMVVAGFVGVLVNQLNVDERTITPDAPTWPMVLPVSVDGYTRNANEAVEPSKGPDNIWAAAANYSKDGQQAIIVLVARPDDPKVALDLATLANKAPLPGAIKVENGMCGFNTETQSNGCVIIKDNTGVLVLARQDQSNTELISIANRFAATMAAG